MPKRNTTDGDEAPESEGTEKQPTIESSAGSSASDDESQTPEANEPDPNEPKEGEDNSDEGTAEKPEDAPASEGSDDPESAELLKWAEKKGLDTKDPVKILKAYQQAEKRITDTGMQMSELRKKVNESSDGADDSEAVIKEARLINYYNTNPQAFDYDEKMGEIYGRFQQSDPDFAEHLLRHPDTLYAMARTEDGAKTTAQARQQGEKQAIEKQRKAQTASSPRTNAVTTERPSTDWSPEKIEQAINDGSYEKHRKEILTWEKQQYGL